MSKYKKFADSERGDSFVIPTVNYAPDEVVHKPSPGFNVLPPAHVINNYRLSIALARHHIISWKIIRECWNKCVDDKLDATCLAIVRLLSERRDNEQPNSDELCWAKKNLIIGPLGNHRMFDPGHEIDFESPIGMSDGTARQRHIAGMVELGKLMKSYVKNPLTKEEFRKRFHVLLEVCGKAIGDDICVFKREEWNLHVKPEVSWSGGANGPWLAVGAPAPPLWHRGSYKTAASYWDPTASDEEKRKKTNNMKRKTYEAFINSIGSDKKWQFVPKENPYKPEGR